jgi:hypothetical protein
MDLAPLSDWLKTTIPGIIVLGAIGSILAALVIWLVNRLLLPVLGKAPLRSFTRLLIHFAAPAAGQLARFLLRHGAGKLDLFFTLQIMKLVPALFVATCAFILFSTALLQSRDELYRATVLLPLIVAFLGLWYALRCIAMIMVPLYYDIEKKVQEAKAKFEGDRGRNAS